MNFHIMEIADANGTIRRATTVTLSERNLRALLHKLTVKDSSRTIYRRTSDVDMLYITAEADAEHYRDREPGEMHPDTENELAAQYASKEAACLPNSLKHSWSLGSFAAC